jgi:hypothetical protein
MLSLVSKLLPKAARDKLIAASATGKPSSLRREIAINRAIDQIKADYPAFFTKEQCNETHR